jgi:KAP family P-loop domain
MANVSKPTPDKSSSPIEPGHNRGRQDTARNLVLTAALTMGLAISCIAGAMDRSVRADPFNGAPSWWQWLSKPQPDPRLAIMPVLPMGPAGVLSWRPQSTAWIVEKFISPSSGSSGRSAAGWFGLGRAQAGEPAKPRPKFNPIELPLEGDLKSSKIPPQQPLNSQQQPNAKQFQAPLTPRPPPKLTLVPDPAAETKFANLPPRTPLPADAYWAGCDVKGILCAGTQGTKHFLSTDGGRTWHSDSSGDHEDAPLLVYGDRPYLIFSNSPIAKLTPGQASSLTLIDSQLPFALAEYGLRDQTRGFRASTLNDALDQIVRQYLRTTGAAERLTFVGVLLPNKESLTPRDLTGKVFVLFSRGRALTATLNSSADTPDQISHQTAFIDDIRTEANLRSLHFQPDQQIGWISSGWNDGNEEGAYPAIFQTTNGGAKWDRLSYRSQYAPWMLYFAMPGFIFAFFATGAAWSDYRASRIDEGIAGVGTSDSPIGWNDLDVLGLKPLALSLSRFVRNSNTAPPLTIAVTGPWGTGKSSLMNLVAEDLRQRGADPVWFNAWHHQKEENILAALLENIRAQAIPSIWRLSGLAFRLRLLSSRMGKNVLPLLLAIAIIATLFYIFDWRSLATSLATLTSVISEKTISNWLDNVAGIGAGALLLLMAKIYGTLNLRPSELMATLRGNAKLADFSAQLGFRYKFAIEFNAAGQALRSSTNPGLVIFIDDLDRCAPANLMEVLESINFLTTAGPCFIFLGMDEPKVVEIVAKQYGDNPERARQYLKKLINLTVPIPEVDESNSINLSAGADPSIVPASQWPKRIRAALRYIPDAGVPALALIAAIWFLASQVTTMPPQSTPNLAPQQAATKPGTADSAGGAAPTPDASPTNVVTADVKIPAVTADQLMSRAQVHPFLGIGLAALTLVLLVARRITTTREDKVEDSRSFREALAIWHPAVFAADPTPRGVKRHQNRLRLQAMRLRPPHEKPDLLDLWFSVTTKADGKSSTLNISEPTLVALGGIAALCGDIPDWSINAQQTAATAGAATAGPSQEAIVTRCRSKFESFFPHDWPPTQAAIGAFKTLRRAL